MGNRKNHQKYGARFVRQPRHPVTGARLWISGNTIAELDRRCAFVGEVRRDYEMGMVDARTASARLAKLTRKPQTVAHIFMRWLDGVSEASRTTIESTWKNRLAPWFGELAPYQLTQDRMRIWCTKQREGGSAPKSIRIAYAFLAGALKLAIELGELDVLPWGAWRPPPGKRQASPVGAASVEELRALLEQAHARDRVAWDRGHYAALSIVCAVGALTGLRHRELAALGWDAVQIDREPFVLHILYQARKGWSARNPDRPRDAPKGGRTTTQQLHADAATALRAQRAQLERFGWYRSDGPVFPVPGGGWSKTGDVAAPVHMRELAQAAGLPRAGQWNVHSLRHSFASLESIYSGGDLRRTMGRTRHADIQTLEGYLHAATLHGRSAIPSLALSAASAGDIVAPALAVELPSETSALLAEAPATAPPPSAIVAARAASPPPEPWTLERAAREHVAAGEPEKLPVFVREKLRDAYTRAYNAVRYAGGTKESAQAAGRRARRALTGAFGKLVARERTRAAS